MELNRDIELAYDFLSKTGVSVFLTGKAGTGKTTFLRSLSNSLHKRMVVVAPTGVAALNAGGVTIHSFFQLSFGPFVPDGNDKFRRAEAKKFSKTKISIIRSLELLVIDEISMVRSDTLDAIDDVLRRIRRNNTPFGGVQLLMIGDVQQLSPIVGDDERAILAPYYRSPFFFDSTALCSKKYITIELKKIYRQSDEHFTSLLNAVRENKMTEDVVKALNKRYIPDFTPEERDGFITLTTHNNTAANINAKCLRALEGESLFFKAEVSRDFPESIYPTDEVLELKEGAQVIFIKNDSSPEKRYYNGMIGTVTEIDSSHIVVEPHDKSKESVWVTQELWENIEYSIDKETSEIISDIKGTFKHFPLKCAWAITVHKSQGLTFERAVIDVSSAFAHGQVYVALSRCRTLEGLVLRAPLKRSSVITDYEVNTFSDYVRDNQPDDTVLNSFKQQYYKDVLCDIVDFSISRKLLFELSKLLNENLIKVYPQLCEQSKQTAVDFNGKVYDIGTKFQRELERLVMTDTDYETSEVIHKRLAAGALYFLENIISATDCVNLVAGLQIDSKEVKKRVKELSAQLKEELSLSKSLLNMCRNKFSVSEYQRIKVSVVLEDSKIPKEIKTTKSVIPKDVIHPELYDALSRWRKNISEREGKPAFTVLTNMSIVQIQAVLPYRLKDLMKISGIGQAKSKQYGEEIIEIVKEFCISNNIDPERDGFSDLAFDAVAAVAEEEEEEKPIKKVKIEKEATHMVTYKMYKSGKSLDEIAKERELNLTTIESHISKLISLDVLNISEFVSKERFEIIKKSLEENDMSRKETKTALGDEISWGEINMVISEISRSSFF